MPEKDDLPPAPTANVGVTVSLDMTPDWLAAHGLEIIGWDDARGGALVRKKTVAGQTLKVEG